MKTNLIKALRVTILLSTGIQHGHSQGTFGNLRFENPIPPLTPDMEFKVPISNALPRWNGYIGGNVVNRVLYNTVNLDAAGISLHSSTSPVFQPLEGNYSVFLQGSSIYAPTASATIGQSATIPQDAQSLLFFASSLLSFQVTFAGQSVPLLQMGTGANYVIIGGDISTFAGQTGELRFTAPPESGGLLDNVQFSIPEPGVFGLAALGAVLVGWRVRRRRR